MPLYEDLTGLSEDRPSTEDLFAKHFPVFTLEDGPAQIERLFAQSGQALPDGPARGVTIAMNVVKGLDRDRQERENRAEVRRRIIPILRAVQEGVEYFLQDSPTVPLFTRRDMSQNKLRTMLPTEIDRVECADFPTLRHFMVELRESMLLLMTAGMSKAWTEFPDRQELADLGQLISERREQAREVSPEAALPSVLMASFGTPVHFYWNALIAMFERSWMQRGEPLETGDLRTLIKGEHEIVDAVTKRSITDFRALEETVASELPPGDLVHMLEEQGSNVWNPDMVWLSGKAGTKDQRLEFSESMIKTLPFNPTYEPVTCSARGKPMEWFQNLFERMVRQYVMPVVPDLNRLTVEGLWERARRKSS